jgi:pimeloyl-ACP methyl ester carboxylesterase
VLSRRLQLATGLGYQLLEWGADDPARDHTILLLHGFLDHAHGWQLVVEQGLADRYHVVAPDLRGHGDSDWVGRGGYYHFFDYLADVHEVVKACARARISLVGHSMGGAIASYYAGAFPARVHKLVVMEGLGPPSGPPTGPERVITWLADCERSRRLLPRRYPDVAAAARRMCQHDPLLDPALALELAAAGTRATPDGVEFKHDPLHATRGPYGFDMTVAERFWRNVTCAVLLVEGGASTFRHSPEEAQLRERCFLYARKVTIPDAGHMMLRHQPAALARELVDFLG